MTYPTPEPISAPQGRPASTTPIADVFQQSRIGLSADGAYAVLPGPLLESMPLHWKRAFATAMAQLQHDTGQAPWPLYDVNACRYAVLTELSEDKLREVGVTHEVNDDGELVYRWLASGEQIDRPEQQQVLITIPDPLLSPPREPR